MGFNSLWETGLFLEAVTFVLLFFSGGHHWQWIRPKRRGFYLFWETLLNIYLYMNLFPTSCTAFYYIDVTIGTSFLFRDYLEQRLKTLALVSCGSKGRWLLRSMVEAFSSEPHSSLCLWSVFLFVCFERWWWGWCTKPVPNFVWGKGRALRIS